MAPTPVEPAATPLALVMPMAGRGTRFVRGGESVPKPLINLGGKPFFWWAAHSVLRQTPVGEMVCVVLDDHIADFAIDARIHEYFPQARIVGLPGVTNGAAETAKIGLEALETAGPVAINDSDHAFDAPGLAAVIATLGSGSDAGLLCFASDDPAYSYARLNEQGGVTGTVEKHVISTHALAGCYLFAGRDIFLDSYAGYARDCPYDELFVSGIYNRLIADGAGVSALMAERHMSFGTPQELARVDVAALAAMIG